MNMQNDVPQFPILSTDRYLTVLNKTAQQVKDQLQMPVYQAVRGQTTNPYPRWFTASILTALMLVMGFSFWISSGKQAAAMGIILDHLPGRYTHLSQLWADTSIAFMLFLGELGSILFLVASGTIAAASETVTIWHFTFRPGVLIFRAFAGLCAAFAIISNITITALDPVPQAVVLQWLVSIGIPLIVLAIGLLLESMVQASLKAAGESKARHSAALADYEAVLDDVTRHTSYKLILADNLWTELNRYKDVRQMLEIIAAADPRNRKMIVIAEYRAHRDLQDFDLEGGDVPFLA